MTDRFSRRLFTGGLLGLGLWRGRGPDGGEGEVQGAGSEFDVRGHGARGDGRANDTDPVRGAIAAAQRAGGGSVRFPRGRYRLQGALTLPAGVRLVGEGPRRSALLREFDGPLVTIASAPDVEISDLMLDGAAPRRAGPGILVTGAESMRPVFRNVLAEGFTGPHLQFGPDAGQLAYVEGWRSRIGGSEQDFVGVRIAGPDSVAAFRTFVGLHVGMGIVVLEGAQDTQFSASSFGRIETDAKTEILTVMGCIWANRGRPMVLHGRVMNVLGCRMAGPVTLSSSYIGSFIGNVLTDTSYTLTDESHGPGNALVLHKPLGEDAIILGRHRLPSTQAWAPVGTIPAASTMVVGDGDVTLKAGSSAATVRYTAALTAPRRVTLAPEGARDGTRFRVVRTGLGRFPLDVGGLKTIPAATAAWVDVEFDGREWVLTGYGLL